MKLNRPAFHHLVFGATLFSSLFISGCGKSVDLVNRNKNGGGFEVPKENWECETGDRTRWRWQQPQPSLSRSVDLLFVVDSSLSLTPERRKLARSISSFLDQLPSDADPRISVMLGHGGSSDWNGRLYSRGSDPRVINPAVHTGNQAEDLLVHAISCPAVDTGLGGGEMLLHSLQSSLEDHHFASIQREGFYRPDASLAVVFITDENDVCFDPREHGYTRHPHYKPSLFAIESFARKKYCLNPNGSVKVSTTSVISSLRNRFPGKQIAMAGIVHSVEKNVPWLGEDAIGHGIIEIVNENASSAPTGPMAPVIMDLKSGDFAAALSKLGSMVSSSLSLLTSFELTGSSTVDPETIMASVDGREVSVTYDAATRTIHLEGADAGGAGSQIDVSACPL